MLIKSKKIEKRGKDRSNLTKQSLMDIWQGEKFQRFRELHKKGEHDKIPICKGCGALVDGIFLFRSLCPS